jgi:hypothetical protein
MSAFLVSSDHVDALVTAVIEHDNPYCSVPAPDWAKLEDRFPGAFAVPARRKLMGEMRPRENVGRMHATELARALLIANLDSLRARYTTAEQKLDHDAEEVAILAHLYTPQPLSVVSLLKQSQCFAYQACEVSDWDSCWAKAFTVELESVLINALPGFDDAPWGV